ncbi:MAG: DUF262 domain-containing protein [Pseudomonadales bacterium]
MKFDKLIASIPANNQKIIELYQKLDSGRLNKSPDYQRKKVWRRQHKYEFIDTILKNFPFPEVYIAPEKVDTLKLELTEQIVDGQQRLTTIQDYINGHDVFSQEASVPLFSELDNSQKEDFLNYEVSVRYLKNATFEQIKEIFQRINRTDYALNKMERFHAIWGESELVCLAKQVIEVDLEINVDLLEYRVSPEDREWLLQFFISGVDDQDGLFSEAEINRMLSLQFILVVLTTLILGEYFHRNSEIEDAVKSYNEAVPDAALVIGSLVSSTKFIAHMNFNRDSVWMRQSSLLTLICELSKYDVSSIDPGAMKEVLLSIENAAKQDDVDENARRYLDYTKEAVNEKRARVFRGEFIRGKIENLLSDAGELKLI